MTNTLVIQRGEHIVLWAQMVLGIKQLRQKQTSSTRKLEQPLAAILQ